MATYALTIDGNAKTLLAGSLGITETANGRNTLSLAILSADGSYRPAVRDEIILTEDVGAGAVRIFGGHVADPTEAGLGGYGVVPIVTTVQADDYNALADRRQVSGVIPAGTLKAALQWIEPYLTPVGVALDVAQATGPDLPEIPFDGLVVSSALTQIVSAASGGWVWEIDYNLTLRAFLPSSTAAPFNITAHDGHVIGDIVVGVADGAYANRVVVRWTSAARSAYAFFNVVAGNFIDGDTVTVGSTTYTYRDAPAGATEVQVGADAEVSLISLAAVITTQAQCWSYLRGPLGGGPTIVIFAAEAGTAGNAIALASSNAIGVFFGEGGGVLTTLANGADQALTNQAIAEDLAEQTSEGVWEQTFAELAILSADVAQAVADGYLAKLLVLPLKRATYTTAETGLHPGQKQSITEPDRGLSGWFTITDVQIVSTEGNVLHRVVTAVGGTALPYRWQDDARHLFGGSGLSGAGGFLVLAPAAEVSPAPFPLGGSRYDSVPCGTTPAAAYNYLPYTALVSGVVNVRVDVKARTATHLVTPKLYDITVPASPVLVATSPNSGGDAGWETLPDFPATLTAGQIYALWLVTDNADGDGYAIGQLVP